MMSTLRGSRLCALRAFFAPMAVVGLKTGQVSQMELRDIVSAFLFGLTTRS